jgi:hypothetical protein
VFGSAGIEVPSDHGESDADQSEDDHTAQRGLAELARRGVLDRNREPKKAPLAPKGFTFDHHHTLVDPFADGARASTRKKTR